MKTKPFVRALSMLAIPALLLTACSKSKDGGTDNPGNNGSIDGTYVMVSKQSVLLDTTNYIPYGGDMRVIVQDTLNGYSFKGTLIIKDDSIFLNGAGHNNHRKYVRYEYLESTHLTVEFPRNEDINGTTDNYRSSFTKANDTLTFKDAGLLDVLLTPNLPTFTTKAKFSFANSRVTFSYVDYFTGAFADNTGSYHLGSRYTVTTVFQKQ